MPHIRVRGLNESEVKRLSGEIVPDIAMTIAVSPDDFSFERISTEFYRNGVLTKADPMIEVLWFDRGQEMQDICAKKITEAVKRVSPAEFIAVVFTSLPRKSYYENGVHF